MIKERLDKYRDLVNEAEQLEERIQELKEQLTSITSQRLDEVQASGGTADKIGNIVCNLVELQTIYQDKYIDLIKETIAIEVMVNTLDSKDRILMRKKYIEGKTLEEICVEMGYCYRNVIRIHKRAIRKLNDRAQKDVMECHI